MRRLSHWKFLADLNISLKTVSFLSSLGIDVVRVDKSVSTDDEVVELARNEGRAILTFDKDFGEIYYFHEDRQLTVVVLYVEDQTAEAVNALLGRFFEEVEFAAIENKLVILYEHRYRLVG